MGQGRGDEGVEGKGEGKAGRAYAMLALVMLLWAGNAIVGRAARGSVPPLTLAFLRWLGTFALLLPFAWTNLVRDWRALAAAWVPTLLLGLAGIATFNALLYSALTVTSASNALLIQAAIPPTVLAFDRMWFGVRPGLSRIIGTVLSTLGVLVVILHGDLWALARVEIGRGELMVLIGVAAWSLYTVGLRRRPAVSGTTFLLATVAVGVVTMAPLAAWEAWRGLHVAWSLPSLGAVLYVAVFPSLVGYLLYNGATRLAGPAPAAQAMALLPLFGAVLAAVVLHETLAGYHYVGMGLILAGLVLGAVQPAGQPR